MPKIRFTGEQIMVPPARLNYCCSDRSVMVADRSLEKHVLKDVAARNLQVPQKAPAGRATAVRLLPC